ncbi:unnamed protein product [Absidia cylindrospora]
MGKLFKLWFKKKKIQEPMIHPTVETTIQEQQSPPTITKFATSDETHLTFTHGSLLDDVLNGLKDHHEHSKTKQSAPDLPLSSSVRHLDSWSKIGTVPEHQKQQKQTFGESNGNNGSSTHTQIRPPQTFLCSPAGTPETPSDSVCAAPPPSSVKMVAPPSSAATPSSSSSSLSPSRLGQNIPHNENGLSKPTSPTNDQVDDSEESSSGPETVGSNDMATTGYHQQQKYRMTAEQQQDTQHNSLSFAKSPSSTSSHESIPDKRNQRYSQATGVSMSRMKERHRQECRRSMQPSSQQQQSQDTYHHQSFQSTPLLGQQQQQQQKMSHINLQQHRHLLASPSMPSIYHVESIPPPLHTMSPPHHSLPAATSSATSYSLPPPPANTMPMTRSSSLMTDIHYQQPSTPGGNIGTMAMSPLANDFMHPPPSWRHQPLFPYQSDIILPPYSPSQLGTIQHQQHMMQSPYRVKQTLIPRSASVYGNANQYHYKSLQPHDINHVSGALLRSPTMDFNGSRKSVPTSTRHYQPQLLSLSTQLPLNSLHAPNKQQTNGSTSPLQPADRPPEATTIFPASFLPSSSSPSNESTSLQQQHQQTPLSSSSSSLVSSACTTPTNIDPKLPATMRRGSDDHKGDANDMQQVVSRHTSSEKSSNKGGLDEKLEIPSPEEQHPHKSKQHRRQRDRQRRRLSLPSTMPILSGNTSSSSLSLNQATPTSNEKSPPQKKHSPTPTFDNDNYGKLELEIDHSQHQHQQHPLSGSSSACPTTNSNGMHLCNSGICSSTYALPTAPCCPTPLSPTPSTCQSPHHHHHPHYHHQYPNYPQQHYIGHSYSCSHPPLSSPCCPPPPPPPSSCCPPRSHHHHHHHRHHRHHRHATTTKEHMRKSKSCMTKAAMDEEDDDIDDSVTIESTSGHGRKRKPQSRRQQIPTSHSMMEPTNASNDDDDDHTVNGDTGQENTTMKTSPSQQKPFLRSLLPRAPRFTSLPRAIQEQDQQQQKQKTKMTTSKSSYSWMPSRA